jgi:hypothetical protein
MQGKTETVTRISSSPHCPPGHTEQMQHCVAMIHSLNLEARAKALAHHHEQFRLGCVCSAKTI